MEDISRPPGCPDAAVLFGAVDGDLPLEDYQAVAGHLEQCEYCRDRVRAVEDALRMDRLLAREVPTAEAVRLDRFKARLHHERFKEQRRHRRRWLAVAAVILVAGGLVYLFGPSSFRLP